MENNLYSTITSDTDKVEVGTKLLEAFNTKDWDLFRSLITEDCTWSLPGQNNLSGFYEGSEHVINKAVEFAGKLSLVTNHIPYSLNCIAVAIYNQSAKGALNLDEHIATVGIFRDGKISTMKTFFSDERGINKFFS